MSKFDFDKHLQTIAPEERENFTGPEYRKFATWWFNQKAQGMEDFKAFPPCPPWRKDDPFAGMTEKEKVEAICAQINSLMQSKKKIPHPGLF